MGFGKKRGLITEKTIGKIKIKWVMLNLLQQLFQIDRTKIISDVYRKRINLLDYKEIAEYIKKNIK